MNMKNSLKIIVAWLLFAVPLMSCALPYSMNIWQSPEGDYVYLLNDAHIDTSLDNVIEQNKAQAAYLSTYAKKHGLTVVVENVFDYPIIAALDQELQKKVETILEQRFEQKRPILKQFIHLPTHEHDNAINMEFRQLRALEEYRELDNALVHAVIAEIETYEDGPILTPFYQNIINTVKKQQEHNPLYYDAQLLDARLVHYLYQHQLMKNSLWSWAIHLIWPHYYDLIIAVGGHHNDRLQALLPSLGYQKVAATGHEPMMLKNPLSQIQKDQIAHKGFTFIDEKNGVALQPFTVEAVLA